MEKMVGLCVDSVGEADYQKNARGRRLKPAHWPPVNRSPERV
jgi:hypothetical protein